MTLMSFEFLNSEVEMSSPAKFFTVTSGMSCALTQSEINRRHKVKKVLIL